MIIGLFGTCGNSKWRDRFMDIYEHYGIEYFNPQVDDWQPENAEIEADHLANDEMILFPVTDETLGLGSLGEVGFSILQAIKLDTNRDIIVMIDKNLNENAKSHFDESMIRESIKMRALIKAHLNKLNYPNVYMVEDLENMLMLSLKLHEIHILRKDLSKYTL